MVRKKKFSIERMQWRPYVVDQNDKGEWIITIPTYYFIEFLAELGYRYTMYQNKAQVIRVIDKVIYFFEDYSEIIETIKKWFKENSENGEIEGVSVDSIFTKLMNKTPMLFSWINLKFLPLVSIKLLKDRADTVYIPFKNVVLEVRGNQIKCIKYRKLKGHILATDILPRKFVEIKEPRLFSTCPFTVFLFNAMNRDIKRFVCMLNTTGYLLSRYQVPSQMKAVILMDEGINELNSAMGGRGKTLFTNGLTKIRNLVPISGKDFDSRYNFAFQRIDHSTDIMLVNDAKPDLDISDFFVRITDGFSVHKKYEKEFVIQMEDMPKTVITTNYVVKAPSGNSSERRMHQIEFSDYYGKDRTVYDDLGHHLFEDWTAKQWSLFDLFMIQCIMHYLRHGLLTPPQINIAERRAIMEIGIETMEYLDSKSAEKNKHHKGELYKEFVTGGYIDAKYKPSRRTFIIKVKKFLDYKNLPYREVPSGTKSFIEIISDDDHDNYSTIDDINTDYRTVDTENKITRMINLMEKHFNTIDDPILALDFETDGLDVHTNEPVSLALSFKPKTGFNIILPKNIVKRNKLIAPIINYLEDDSITKVMHNAKFDLKFFEKLGIRLKGEVHDTMILDYVIDPTSKSHGLKQIASKHLNYKMIDYKTMSEGKDIKDVDTARLTRYAVEDADITLQLYHLLKNKIL
ncbi:3'-5' exonuclease family protein [Aegicerativicinus sediminis]|uniref:hypothetical protein n=1 Tax=Aegicerativicinus sediminis TaxID=2893202 RepID=UPI001E5381DE|nr:hypothetical protein [Aegicerativicinus sediminis]